MASIPNDAAREWRAGWPVVLACAFGIGFMTLHTYSLGLFITPLAKAYGWSRAEIGVGPAIASVVGFFAAPRVGRLADRHGVRRFALAGFTAYCVGLAAMGLTGPSKWSWYGHWLFLAACQVLAGVAVWSLAIASRFDRSRGLALAASLSGPGVVAALTPVVATAAIARYGWAATYPLLAAGAFVIGMPMIAFGLHSAHDLRRRGGLAAAVPTAPIGGMTLAEARRSRAFWFLLTCSALLGTGIAALLVHFVPMALERGISAKDAGWAASLTGLCAIGSRMATGFLMDRLPGRLVGAVLFAMPMSACALLLAPGGLPMMTAAAVAIGLTLGAEFDVLAVLVSRYLGMRAYGAVYGQIVGTFGLGIGFGPAIGGALYDAAGDYRTMLFSLGGAFLIPPVLCALLGRVPRWDPAEA
jgi:MFS family permease